MRFTLPGALNVRTRLVSHKKAQKHKMTLEVKALNSSRRRIGASTYSIILCFCAFLWLMLVGLVHHDAPHAISLLPDPHVAALLDHVLRVVSHFIRPMRVTEIAASETSPPIGFHLIRPLGVANASVAA